MLRPKQVVPLLSGARAILASSSSSPWCKSVDHGQSPVNDSPGSAQAKGSDKVLPCSSSTSPVPSDAAQNTPHSAPPLSSLHTAPSSNPVTAQLFRQRTVLPSGWRSSFLSEVCVGSSTTGPAQQESEQGQRAIPDVRQLLAVPQKRNVGRTSTIASPSAPILHSVKPHPSPSGPSQAVKTSPSISTVQPAAPVVEFPIQPKNFVSDVGESSAILKQTLSPAQVPVTNPAASYTKFPSSSGLEVREGSHEGSSSGASRLRKLGASNLKRFAKQDIHGRTEQRPSGSHSGANSVRPFRNAATHQKIVQGISSALKVLETLRSNGDSEDSLSEQAVEMALQPWQGAVNHYHTCDVLKQMTNSRLAMSFLRWSQKQPEYKHDVYVYTTIIGIAGKAKDLATVKAVVQEMKSKGCQPNVVTYNRIIHSYGRANMLEEAMDTVKKMEEEGITPDYVTHSTIVDLYARNGLHEKAVEAVERMKRNGFEPDGYALTCLMNSYGRQGDLLQSQRIFHTMINSGTNPSLVSWNTMIDLHGKAGKTGAALQLFRDMVETGIAPDVMTYTTLIDICGKKGMHLQAEELFEQMLEDGFKPDVVSWGALIQMWGKANEPHKAANWFGRMLEAGVIPSVACFNTLIHGFLKAQMYGEAKAAFVSMGRRGLRPSINTYTLLLSACTACQNQEGVAMMLDLMDACDHPAHGATRLLIMGLGGDEVLWERAKGGLGNINREALYDRRAMFDALMVFLQKMGLNGSAKRVWEEACNQNLWLSSIRFEPGKLWHLDLHYMSEGTVRIVLFAELEKLRKVALGGLPDEFPEKARIVTGWGQRSRVSGVSCVKQSAQDMLQNSPFREDGMNAGLMAAEGDHVKEWILREDVGTMLELKD